MVQWSTQGSWDTLSIPPRLIVLFLIKARRGATPLWDLGPTPVVLCRTLLLAPTGVSPIGMSDQGLITYPFAAAIVGSREFDCKTCAHPGMK
jgi:hypothetical protein